MELIPLVYEELRRLARHQMANEMPGQTLQPTALVHEVWLSVRDRCAGPPGKVEALFGAAAEAMRRILVETGEAPSADETWRRDGTGRSG